MPVFPSLTFHALDISGDFASFQEALDCFAKGSRNVEARVGEALCCSMIVAWKQQLAFDIETHLNFPDRCSRLLYTALYARMFWGENDKIISGILELEHGLDQKEYDLFENTPYASLQRTEIALRAHLKSSMCHKDIVKKIPGLTKERDFYTSSDIQRHLRTKNSLFLHKIH